MNGINCLITTPGHREIAGKLGISPAVVTAMATVYLSKFPRESITTQKITNLMHAAQVDNERHYLDIPVYTGMQDTASSNQLIRVLNNGEIKLWKLPKENPMNYFFKYFSGRLENEIDRKQRKAIFDKLLKDGHLGNLTEWNNLFDIPVDAYRFLLWYADALRFNKDKESFDVQYEATVKALNKVKEFRRRNPIDRGYQGVEFYQENNDNVEAYIDPNETISIEYTPTGKARQTYTVKGDHIYNKNGKEVFAEDSKDRTKIFANVAVQQKQAVVVTYKDNKYVVDNNDKIVSVTTGNVMQWEDTNGNRKNILALAAPKLDELKSNQVPQHFKSTNEVAEFFGPYYEGGGTDINDHYHVTQEEDRLLGEWMWGILDYNKATDAQIIELANRIYARGRKQSPEVLPQQQEESVVDQVIQHLKELGIPVKNRAEMKEFLKTHKIENLQQASEAINYEAELNAIKEKAIADGTFMKAPNGKPTNLTERQWLQVRTKAFKEWFGDWQNVNNLLSNLNKIDSSLVDVEQHYKPWKNNKNKGNNTLRIYLKDHSKGYFELVKDEEFGMYSVHFKTAREGGKYNAEATISTKEDRKILFKELIKLIPNGAQISTWGEISEDGIKGINNLGRDLIKIGEREITRKSDGSKVSIPIYQKGEGVSKVIDENGEPLVVYHGTESGNFTKFQNGKYRATNGGLYAVGMFTTTDLNTARRYGRIYNTPETKSTEEFYPQTFFPRLFRKPKEKIPNSERAKKFAPKLNSDANKYDYVWQAPIGTFQHSVYSLFLNIKNPKYVDYEGKAWNTTPEEITRYYHVDVRDKKNYTTKTIPFKSKEEAEKYFEEFTSKYKKKMSLPDTGKGWIKHQGVKGIDGYNVGDDEYIFEIVLFEETPPNTVNGLASNAERAGYDGLIVKNIKDANLNDSKNYAIDEFIPFTPNQLKSATDNNGNFSLTNDDIQAFIGSKARAADDVAFYIDNNGHYNSTVNITQNSSGRLGQFDADEEASYREAKNTLRNPKATEEEIKEAEKTLDKIYSRKKNQLQQILNTFTEFSNSKFTIEDAGGSWLGGEEYSFKVSIQAETQEDYDKALLGLSYVAEGLKQDAFIENLGEVDESEVTNEGLLNGDYTPTIHIAFAKTPTAREKALIQQDFTSNSTEDLPLDATITDNEIVFNFPAWKIDENLSDEEKIKAYNALLENWKNKINNILKEGKNDRFKDTYIGNSDIKFERSRFHSADSTEGTERQYSNYRNNNFPSAQQQGISEEKGREIRDFANKVVTSKSTSQQPVENFTTSSGTVYGFVDRDGNIYLDEEIISAEHGIHEFTHLWDRVVQKHNPALWQRGVELMKQTTLWNEYLNNEHYGKRWQAMGITGEKLDSLIASEIHARLVGKRAQQELNDLEAKQGKSGIIAKLRKWISDFWKDLKETFGNWSQKDLNDLKEDQFIRMAIRDFAGNTSLNDLVNNPNVQTNKAISTTNNKQEASVDNMPKVSSDRVKVNTENPAFKLASTFTPIQRMDRVKLIARWFYDITMQVHGQCIENIEKQLEEATAKNDTRSIKELKNALEYLNDPVKGLQYAIKVVTPEAIIKKIQNIFEETRDSYSDDDPKKQGYQDILDNFEFLFDQASFIIGENLPIKLEVTTREKTKVGGNISEQEEDNGEGREYDDDDEHGNRATGNDGWSFKVRMVDPRKTLSKTTKKILYNIAKKDAITGELEEDDLGNIRYLNPSYVHAVLIDKLSSMIDSNDFFKEYINEDGETWYSFPALEKLIPRYPWVEQITEYLLGEALEGNFSPISAFYTDLRKDFIPYWKNVYAENAIKTIPLNRAVGYQSIRDVIILNYESGNQIDAEQIYNTSRQLVKANVMTAKNYLQDIDKDIESAYRYEDKEEQQRITKLLSKVANMIGFPVFEEAINSLWESEDSETALLGLWENLNGVIETAENIADKKNTHLINEANMYFKKLFKILGEVSEMDAVMSFTELGDSYYSYSAPNYISTQIKLLNSLDRKQEYLNNEFKAYSWFYNNGKWEGSAKGYPCLLELIEEGHINEIETKNLLDIEGLKYSEWTPSLIEERFIYEYFSAGKGVGYYHYPIFADAPVATLVKLPRFETNYKEEVIPRLRQVVKQELKRIELVRRRIKEDVSPIANFDGKRGLSFCFFPFLNTYTDNGLPFIDKISQLSKESEEAVNSYIDSVLSIYMTNMCEDFISEHEYMLAGMVNNGTVKKVEEARYLLEEYFYNNEYMQTQIIQLTVTDPAFFKDDVDFQKRYKQVYAAGNRLFTKSKYGREVERTVYLKDPIATSTSYTDIKEALQQTKDRWIAEGMNPKVAEMSIDTILNSFKGIELADAQAYRSISSMRAVLDMMGIWDDNMQKSFDRIVAGEWDLADFNTVWQTIKPFVYTQVSKDSKIDGKKIKVPHQNKNSETLLLAMYQIIAQSIGKSPQLRALNKFMEEQNIDVVQFGTAVKSGKQGLVDINYSEKKLQKWIQNNKEKWNALRDTFNKETLDKLSDYEIFKKGNDNLLDRENGGISQKEYNDRMHDILPSEDEVTEILKKYTLNEDGSYNEEVVHSIPYKDYMQAQPTPVHLFDDEELSIISVGSQFRNLIITDISEDAVFTVNGKSYNKKELLDLYNSIIVENLLEDYQAMQERFSSIEDLQKALLKIVKGNPKYGNNILNALQLIDYTNPRTGETKKVFNLPLWSPSITEQVQELVNSMFKNRITKQHIKGSACVLASSFGVSDKLKMVYKKDDHGNVDGIAYAECYLPWYSKRYFEPFLKTVTDNKGNTWQEVDITKVPKNLLEMVGYRIPTENKYSMLNLKVVGFLPQQCGNTIIVPPDVVRLAGSDFDVDKLYIMMPTYKEEIYDYSRAIENFKKLNSNSAVNKLLASLIGTNTDLESEETTPEEFNEWWETHKEEYLLDTPIIKKVKYNTSKDASKNSRAARDNMMIDISRSILSHKDSMGKILNPGSFDRLKKTGKILTIISNDKLLKAYAKFKGIDTNFENEDNLKNIKRALRRETLDSLENFLKNHSEIRDPLALSTYSYFHEQNMVGKDLTAIYASNVSIQAKFQESGLKLQIVPPGKNFSGTDNTFTINGKHIESLDAIYSPWGELISKNCAEFLAAAVDNVKDPVLAQLLQSKKTATLTCFMLRAGIPISIIGLIFKQPIVEDAIYSDAGLKSLKNLDNKREKKLEITTDELINTIIQKDSDSGTAIKIGALVGRMFRAASNLASIDQVSKADSVNNAIAIRLGEARNQVQKVTQVTKESESVGFAIANVKRALVKNDVITADSSIEEKRKFFRNSRMSKLQAFYSLGINLPLQTMAPFFIQLNNELDEVLKDIYQEAPYGMLTEKMVSTFYKDFIEYTLTKRAPFASDENGTFDEKRDYYLYKFPAEFYKLKQQKKFNDFSILRKMYVEDGQIKFKKGGKMTKDVEEALIADFDGMIASNDPEIVQLALDLFMYSFYKDGYYWGPSSYGNFFSPVFIESIPGFMESLRDIESEVEGENFARFKSQFYNNYWESITKKIKDNFGRVSRIEPSNPDSDISIPKKLCINPMTGAARNPYKIVQYNDNLYSLSVSSSSTCTYTKMITVKDEQGKKYNAAESLTEMEAHVTPGELIESNKKIGAKKTSIWELLGGAENDYDDIFSALEDPYSNFNEEAFNNIDFYVVSNNDYDIELSKEQLDKPLC